MEKKNSNLRTNNVILNKLNEKYYVVKYAEPCMYGIYETPEGGGLLFLFTAEKKMSAKSTVYFNQKRYSDVDKLMEAVDEYNSTRPYPSWTYDPFLNKEYVMEQRIEWYLTNVLGYKRTNDRTTFALVGGFEMPLSVISYYIRNDKKYLSKETGYDGGYAYIEFEDEDDAIRKLNTISLTEVTCGFEKLNELLDGIRGGFGDLEGSKITSLKSLFNGNEISFKEKVIENLENALEKLKKNTF